MIKKEKKVRNLFSDQLSGTVRGPPNAEIPSNSPHSPALSSMFPTWRSVIPLQIRNWNRNEPQSISNALSLILSVSASFPTVPKKILRKDIHISNIQVIFVL